MRKWIALLIAFGLLLPTAYVHADRVKGAFQSLDVTDNVTVGGNVSVTGGLSVTGTLNVSGTPTFTDNTINGADLIDNTVTSAKILDNSIASSKILDNTIALAKINHTGTASVGTFFRGDGSWAAILPQLVAYGNLVITTPADNQSVTITAYKVVATDTSDVPRILSSVSLTVDLDASGANGLDNGTIAANTGYFLYVIDNGSTTAGLASTSAAAPVMPTGYTYKALVGWCTTDNTATPFNIEEFTQVDDEYIWSIPQRVVNAFASSPNTQTLDLSSSGILGYATVPPSITKKVRGKAYIAGGTGFYMHPVTFSNSLTVNNAVVNVELGMQYGGAVGLPYELPLLTSQTFYFQLDGAQGTGTIWCSGFTLKR